MHVSIWLQPLGDVQRELRDVIADLAARHDTVPFQPHLTVCAVPRFEPAIIEAAAGYVRDSGVLPLRVARTGISCSTTAPFKAVIIDVENIPLLQAFRARLRGIAEAPEFEPPHISLLYTIGADRKRVAWAADAARLQAIAQDVAARVAAVEFVLDNPVVVATEGDWTNIASWKIIREL
jgi:hypothetical protein